MQHVTVACLSISAYRLTSDNLASALSVIEFDSRTGNAGAGVGKAKDVRPTISNAACHHDSLVRRSGVSGVGRRGLPLPPPSALQPGGIHGQW
jgi:hypothetical protein